MKIISITIIGIVVISFMLWLDTSKVKNAKANQAKFIISDYDIGIGDVFIQSSFTNSFTIDSLGCVNFIDVYSKKSKKLCGDYRISNL